MANHIKIETPKGTVIQFQTKNGTIKSQLVWSPEFAPKKEKQFETAQAFVDSEVLRLSDKLTPMRSKFLIRSGTLGTEIGSGEVIYLAPYARRMYYNKQYKFNGAPTRGAYWFERMKNQHKESILKGAGKIVGK